MQRRPLLLLALLAMVSAGRAINETISLTDAVGRDSVTVRVGEIFEISVRVNTNGTYISGFQCFLTVDEDLAVPVPYNASPTGLFHNNGLIPGDVIFADNHDVRFPDDPLPDHQLDWCYQTGFGNPRPAYQANGVACTFRLRFLQQSQLFLDFDHDNNHFRNTLYWEGQSAVEHAFYREHGLFINVIGMDFGPLPDIYLTTPAPCDSLDLAGYLGELEAVPADSVWYTWQELGENTVCSIDTLRLPGQFWMRMCGTGPGRHLDLAVTAHALNLSATDTVGVFRGDPPVVDDDMAAGEPFISWPEDDEAWLDFDDWVTDLDDPVEGLAWSLVPGDYTVSLEIDPVLRRGRFWAPPDWFGLDTLLVRVVDPGGMADSSRLVAQVTPVNDAPLLSLPALLAVHPGQPLVLDLEELTTDIDHDYDDLYWEVEGDTSQVAMRVNPVARTLTLEVQPDTPLWIFVDATLRVTDLGGLWDEDLLRLQVASHPPLWEDIVEVLVPSGGSAGLDLDEYVSDLDNSDAELELSLLDANNVQVAVDPLTHVATFSAPAVFAGVERLRAHARDPQGNTDVDTLLVVALQGGNPLVALVPDLVFLPGARDSLDLDGYVWDMDTPDADMAWAVENSGLFATELRQDTRRVVYTAPDLPGTVDLSWYRATDPQGHWAEDTGGLAVIDPSGRPLIFPMEELWMRVSSVDSTVALDEVVYDYDHEPSELSWSVAPGTLVSAAIRPGDRRLIITSDLTPGTETLALTVTDPDQQEAGGTLVVHVTEGIAPVVSAFAPRFVIAGQTDTLRQLSNWVYDPDPGDAITWSFVDPPASTVHALWRPEEDMALIHTDSLVTGTVQIGAVAQDMARNSDMEWIQLTMLENRPPRLAAAVLANPGEPRLLDLTVVSDEALRSLRATRAGDGLALDVAELVVAGGTVRIHRADLPFPAGVETWRIEGRDLPGYPQVAGNLGRDSLVLGGAVLGRPGDRFPSPDEGLELAWCSGLSNGSWAVREEGGDGDRRWTLLGPAGGRVRLAARDGGLERWTVAGWRAVPDQGTEAEGAPGELLRPAAGASPRPAAFDLSPPWPNPFNPETRLRAQSDREGPASVEVVNLAGQRVRVLWSGPLGTEGRQVAWDGRGEDGLPLASGVYLARLRQGERQAVRKLMLVR